MDCVTEMSGGLANIGFIRKNLLEVLQGLESKENQLNAVQESVKESSKELDVIRESIAVRQHQVEEKEKGFHLHQEKMLKEWEVKKREIDVFMENAMVRQEKMNEQERLVDGLFEKIEMERKEIDVIRKCIDEGISAKERDVEEMKNEVENKAKDLDKKEVKLEGFSKEMELRENVLGLEQEEIVAKERELEARKRVLDLKQEELLAKENELEAREKSLGLRKELDLRKIELDSIKKVNEECPEEPDSANITLPRERKNERMEGYQGKTVMGLEEAMEKKSLDLSEQLDQRKIDVESVQRLKEQCAKAKKPDTPTREPKNDSKKGNLVLPTGESRHGDRGKTAMNMKEATGEKSLDLRKEPDLRKRELDSIKKLKEQCSKKPDSTNLTPSRELTSESRMGKLVLPTDKSKHGDRGKTAMDRKESVGKKSLDLRKESNLRKIVHKSSKKPDSTNLTPTRELKNDSKKRKLEFPTRECRHGHQGKNKNESERSHIQKVVRRK